MLRVTMLSGWMVAMGLLLLATTVGWSCMNEYDEHDKREHSHFDYAPFNHTPYAKLFTVSTEDYVKQLTTSNWPNELEAELARKRIQAENTGNFKDQSNLATALLRLGHINEAVEILEPLAENHRQEYIIAANLGTAYELQGNNHKALEFISKSYGINPESHQQTEWVHIAILEAKIKAESDPDYLRRQPIIDLGFGDEVQPSPPQALYKWREKKFLVTHVHWAIEYQLHERMAFVKPTDAVVANLLNTLATLHLAHGYTSHATRVFQLAQEYDPTPNELLKKRYELALRTPARPITPAREAKDNSTQSVLTPDYLKWDFLAMSITCLTLIGSLGFILWRRQVTTSRIRFVIPRPKSTTQVDDEAGN